MRPHKQTLNVVAAAQPHFSTHQHHYTTQHQKSETVLPSGATASRLQQHPLYSQTLNSPTMSLFHHFMNHSMSSPKRTLSILRLNKLTMLEPSTISTSHSPTKLALITLALASSPTLNLNTMKHQKAKYPHLQFLKHPNYHHLITQIFHSLACLARLGA